jgi:hypothetical protein
VYEAGDGENRLLRNANQNGNHWIEIDLVGVISNRLAIGARVSVTAGGVTHIREVQSGCGYNAQHMHRVHIGLGAATVIDTLEVRWPSGLRQTRTGVQVDQILAITEDLASPFADCDRDGVPDVIEIADGAAGDCDHDGVPDDCDEPCADCNGNGQIDFLDVVAVVSLDCDDNAVPDECQIAANASLDINHNGVLDECEDFGDADSDGDVDVNDLIIVVALWGPCPAPCVADWDGNAVVDINDLILVFLTWDT